MRFRSDPAQIRGSIAPVVTPFDEQGAVDLEALARLVEWQIASGSHGISVHGSTGEPSSQAVEERECGSRGHCADGRRPGAVLPGHGSTHLEETLRLTATADELGADAVLVITPYYSRPTQQGLFEWYSTVAREFPDLPIVVYNVPDPHGCRHRAGDGWPVAPGARQHRRDQGDDARLRACLIRPGRVRPGLPRLLRHRAALLPDARDRRRRPPELRRECRAGAVRRAVRRLRRRRPRRGGASALRAPPARRRWHSWRRTRAR